VSRHWSGVSAQSPSRRGGGRSCLPSLRMRPGGTRVRGGRRDDNEGEMPGKCSTKGRNYLSSTQMYRREEMPVPSIYPPTIYPQLAFYVTDNKTSRLRGRANDSTCLVLLLFIYFLLLLLASLTIGSLYNFFFFFFFF